MVVFSKLKDRNELIALFVKIADMTGGKFVVGVASHGHISYRQLAQEAAAVELVKEKFPKLQVMTKKEYGLGVQQSYFDRLVENHGFAEALTKFKIFGYQVDAETGVVSYTKRVKK